jgi:hypothetical protein
MYTQAQSHNVVCEEEFTDFYQADDSFEDPQVQLYEDDEEEELRQIAEAFRTEGLHVVVSTLDSELIRDEATAQ